VKLNATKLKMAAQAASAGEERLASAIARPGLTARQAPSAIGNWMAGKDHPRAKAADIRKLAAACGVTPKDIVTFQSRSCFMRSSSRKARLVADLIRGKRVDDAMSLLRFSDKRAADMMTKTLKAAISDAEHGEADISRLVVCESRIDAGPTIKRFQPKDRGRAHPIRKRTSHFVIAVEESA
jgi:large subunit ribosomal protein L22